MRISTARNDNTLTIKLIGELDHHSSAALRHDMDACIAKCSCTALVLDLSEVSFMDSSGLGVILGRYKKVNARGGTLTIRGANRTVDRILCMSGMYSLAKKA